MPTWKEGKSWRYQFQHNNKRYSKSGFKSKKDAEKAIIDHRDHLMSEYYAHNGGYPTNIKYKTEQQVRDIFRSWLKANNITPPERCSSCNEEKELEAHHSDYSKPLEVVWLCRKCHRHEHRTCNVKALKWITGLYGATYWNGFIWIIYHNQILKRLSSDTEEKAEEIINRDYTLPETV
jgi:hypothetical protein